MLSRPGDTGDEFAFITPLSTERALRKELGGLSGLEVLSVLHVLD